MWCCGRFPVYLAVQGLKRLPVHGTDWRVEGCVSYYTLLAYTRHRDLSDGFPLLQSCSRSLQLPLLQCTNHGQGKNHCPVFWMLIVQTSKTGHFNRKPICHPIKLRLYFFCYRIWSHQEQVLKLMALTSMYHTMEMDCSLLSSLFLSYSYSAKAHVGFCCVRWGFSLGRSTFVLPSIAMLIFDLPPNVKRAHAIPNLGTTFKIGNFLIAIHICRHHWYIKNRAIVVQSLRGFLTTLKGP